MTPDLTPDPTHGQTPGLTPGLTPNLAPVLTTDTAVTMMDRAAPGWARPLVAIFSTGIGLCFAALCLGTLFVQSMVVEASEPRMAPVLAGLALIPALGLLILEFAQARALAGYRQYREVWADTAQGTVALIAVVVLGFLHPALALAPVLGAGLGAGAVWWTNRRPPEPLWDFLPAESVPILTGRDALGLRLAALLPRDPALLPQVLRMLSWLTLALALAVAGWLATAGVLASAAVPATGVLSLWATGRMLAALRRRARSDPLKTGLAAEVTALRLPPEDDTDDAPGSLSVRGLSVTAPKGWNILSDAAFTLAPGQVMGLQGPPGAGKTMLMRALVSPGDMTGLSVRGAVHLNAVNLWDRQPGEQAPLAAYLPGKPLMLPASGQDNLTFFGTGPVIERGRRILEQMVFAADIVERICATPDATRLSTSEQKALGFARGFLLSPPLLLIDRPEDGASEKLITALAARLRQEVRAGRSVIMATENRALLEMCDTLLVLSEGRIVDAGPAAEIRARAASGWLRFVGARALDTEENLETWVRSHFHRDGDEVNRRRACVVAAELLAFSCASAPPMTRQTLSFEFKHFEGHCLIRMIDRDTQISSGVLQRARDEVAAFEDHGRLSPLATVLSLCPDVETTIQQDNRVLTARLDTYDPRKTGGKPPESVLKAPRTPDKKAPADATPDA